MKAFEARRVGDTCISQIIFREKLIQSSFWSLKTCLMKIIRHDYLNLESQKCFRKCKFSITERRNNHILLLQLGFRPINCTKRLHIGQTKIMPTTLRQNEMPSSRDRTTDRWIHPPKSTWCWSQNRCGAWALEMQISKSLRPRSSKGAFKFYIHINSCRAHQWSGQACATGPKEGYVSKNFDDIPIAEVSMVSSYRRRRKFIPAYTSTLQACPYFRIIHFWI